MPPDDQIDSLVPHVIRHSISSFDDYRTLAHAVHALRRAKDNLVLMEQMRQNIGPRARTSTAHVLVNSAINTLDTLADLIRAQAQQQVSGNQIIDGERT